LATTPIFVDDSPGLSVLSLRSKARRLKSQHDIQMIIVDYLQLMEAPQAESRQVEISINSRSLKALARELKVPVIALSQLNRSVDSRDDKRPRMSDLRESGAIEQDADIILLLFREEYYGRTEANANKATVDVAKQRNGPTGAVDLQFTREFMRFENLAYERGNP
jgi:replicative DNA helicase